MLLFWLEGALEGGELTPHPECSDRAAQGCVCLGFESLQRQRLHSPPGHPVPVVSYPRGDFPSHAMHQQVWLGNLLQDIGRLLLGAPQASSQAHKTSPVASSLPRERAAAHDWLCFGLFHTLCSSCLGEGMLDALGCKCTWSA